MGYRAGFIRRLSKIISYETAYRVTLIIATERINVTGINFC
jgi:hypothetical protein